MKANYDIPLVHPHEVELSENEDFEQALLLLHGFQLDGHFMFKRYSKRFDQRIKVVAPNGPFLVPLKRQNEWTPRYSWYFYDAAKKNFYINYEPAARWLAELMRGINPQGKKTTIVGYSQGGYLAPKVAELLPEAEKVVGINSIFRSSRFEIRKQVEYFQINGELDEVVSSTEAREEFQTMLEKGAKGKFATVEAGHPLNREMIEKSLSFI